MHLYLFIGSSYKFLISLQLLSCIYHFTSNTANWFNYHIIFIIVTQHCTSRMVFTYDVLHLVFKMESRKIIIRTFVCILGVHYIRSQTTKAPSELEFSFGEICGEQLGGHCLLPMECSDSVNGTCICKDGLYHDVSGNCFPIQNLMVRDVNITINGSVVTLDIAQPPTSNYIAYYQVRWSRVDPASNDTYTQNVTKTASAIISVTLDAAIPGKYAGEVASVETDSRPYPQFATTPTINVSIGKYDPIVPIIPSTAVTLLPTTLQSDERLWRRSTLPSSGATTTSVSQTIIPTSDLPARPTLPEESIISTSPSTLSTLEVLETTLDSDSQSSTTLSSSSTAPSTTNSSSFPSLTTSTTQIPVSNRGIVDAVGGICGEDHEKLCNGLYHLECSDQYDGICQCKKGFYNDHNVQPSCQLLINLMVRDVNVTINTTVVKVSFQQPNDSSSIAYFEIWRSYRQHVEIYQILNTSLDTNVVTTYIDVEDMLGIHTIIVVTVENGSRSEAQYIQTAPFNVTIEGKPTNLIILPNSTIIVNEGETLDMLCLADGFPSPSLLWQTTNDVVISSNSSYITDNVTRHDTGLYVCKATNLLGSDEVVASVTVHYRPYDITTVYDRNKIVKENSFVQLNCSVESYPPSQFIWKNSSNDTIGNTQTLVIIVSQSSKYTCYASNGLGAVAIPFTINMIPPDTCGCFNNGTCVPVPGVTNGPVCICTPDFTGHRCETDGKIDFLNANIVPSNSLLERATVQLAVTYAVKHTHDLKVRWIRNGNTLPSASSRFLINNSLDSSNNQVTSQLIIMDVQTRDEGLWYSYISNWYNTTVVPFSLLVQPLPALRIYPYSISALVNDSFSLRCNVLNAVTEMGIDWYKDNKHLTDTVGRFSFEYRVVRASIIDSGSYKCCFHSEKRTCSQISHVSVSLPDVKFCPETTDRYGITWTRAAANFRRYQACPQGYLGSASKLCDVSGQWETTNLLDCVRKDVSNIIDKITDIVDDGTLNSTELYKVIDEGLTVMENVTDLNNNMTSGDLNNAIKLMMDIADVGNGNNINGTKYTGIMNSLLDTRNSDQWNEVTSESADKATAVFTSIDRFGIRLSEKLAVGETKTFKGKNLEIEISKIDRDLPINFPSEIKASNSYVVLGPQITSGGTDPLTYTATLYNTISKYLPSNVNAKNSSEFFIKSKVIALTIGAESTNLNPSVEIGLQHFEEVDKTKQEILCSYWNFTNRTWSSDGCRAKKSNNSFTTCECDHLTNFAILMRPYEKPHPDVTLGIISIVGCSISVVCIALTVVIFIILWRYIKGDQIVILLNICVSLGLAYLVFIIGVDKTENEVLCTVIAVFLQYLFLVVFFLMLAEGIHYFMSVTLVYYYLHLSNDLKARNTIRWLLLQGWGIPAVITAITLGVSYEKGYRSKNFCWLSVNNGVLYGFVGPALLVIVINIIIICTLFRVMYSTTLMSNSNAKRKASAGLRSMCTLLPILGITWLFGILAINETLVAFQYLFAVTNSLQGLFIFIFHCLLNQKIQDGFKKRLKLYESQSEASRVSKIHKIKMGKGKEKPKLEKQQVMLLGFKRNKEYIEYYDNVSFVDDVWNSENTYIPSERRGSNLSSKSGSYNVTMDTELK